MILLDTNAFFMITNNVNTNSINTNDVMIKIIGNFCAFSPFFFQKRLFIYTDVTDNI